MSEALAELFSSRVRAAVLALLLPRPHLRFSLTDLSRRLGLPVSSLQHECYKLTRMKVLCDERVGNTRLYRPNPSWPLLEPLTALTVRALPLPVVLGAAIEGVAGLHLAWLSGDCSSKTEPVYLLLVGEMTVEELDDVFARARVALDPLAGAGRVELAYFRPRDWQARVDAGDPFIASLRAHRRVEQLPDLPPTGTGVGPLLTSTSP
jgi:DNA-binding transcriptional ArsR family regulator